MLTHIHPSPGWFTCKTSSIIKGTGNPSTVSGPAPEPPSAQSRFARRGRYPRRRDVPHLVRGRYTSFIARTGSCDKPNSSLPISVSLDGRSLQVAVSPCWKMALPDVISTVCVKALGPIPRRVPVDLSVWTPLLSAQALSIAGHRPHFNLEKFGTRETPCNATSTGGVFRGCSHSLMFRLPYLLGPPVAPTAVTSTGLPGRLHHAMNMWLPALKRSRFYMNCDIATYPKRTN